jgi:rod shape-determining protein MreB
MNKLIYNYLYLKYGIILGETTIEDTKIQLLNFNGEEKTETVRGKSLETGLPKAIKVKSSDIREALLANFNQILDTIKEVIELSPPEVVDELYKNGLILTGGVANAPAIDAYFKEELKIDVKIAEQKDTATISGLMRTGRRKDYKERLQFVTA